MDRSTILKLRRKLPHEQVERLRHAEDCLFKKLESMLGRFAQDYGLAVSNARPELPASLNDREQDNWEPLLAIGDIAGGDWPIRARTAALQLANMDNSTRSLGTDLLLNIKEIFENKKIERISSADLIHELCVDEGLPWATYNYGKPISPRQIASLLKEYGIKSKSDSIGYSTRQKGLKNLNLRMRFLDILHSPYLPNLCATRNKTIKIWLILLQIT